MTSFWNPIRSTPKSRQWRGDGLTEGVDQEESWMDLYMILFASIRGLDREMLPKIRCVWCQVTCKMFYAR